MLKLFSVYASIFDIFFGILLPLFLFRLEHVIFERHYQNK